MGCLDENLLFFFLPFRYDDGIQVKHVVPKEPSGVFYATPTEIPKTQQFGVSLTWCVFYIISMHGYSRLFGMETVCVSVKVSKILLPTGYYYF